MPAGIGPEWDGVIAELIAAGRQSVEDGLAIASGGNFSVRLEGSDDFLITGTGTHLNRLTRDSFALLTASGERVEGCAPSSEWRLHSEAYRQRPDGRVLLHLHPEVCVTLDLLGIPIRQMTLDHVAYIPRIERIGFYPNGSPQLGTEAAQAMTRADCVILGNHGCSVIGSSVDDALRKINNLEQAARMTMAMAMLGDRSTEFPRELRSSAVHAG
ncbi:class II aldolase/adducin family protein [Salinibacterium sp. M195]|uniref:class II aldolase/adducin family protein n=1 Tax=Salinibacterium sp. M195 TaxID=2583374 RepID=UPI001C6373AE|nr:class II aldolase/adducin family protein [Salinibacterium sp. M195]QYH36014.1 class II aldolase/adducin family protein [Salinibacterium sp. M195]